MVGLHPNNRHSNTWDAPPLIGAAPAPPARLNCTSNLADTCPLHRFNAPAVIR